MRTQLDPWSVLWKYSRSERRRHENGGAYRERQGWCECSRHASIELPYSHRWGECCRRESGSVIYGLICSVGRTDITASLYK